MLGVVRPWQLALVIVSAPGLLIAALVSRLPELAPGVAAPAHPPLVAVIAYFRRNLRSFTLLKLATGFAAMALYATAAWSASLLIRTHDWSIPAAGAVLGPLFMAAGALGSLGGGDGKSKRL